MIVDFESGHMVGSALTSQNTFGPVQEVALPVCVSKVRLREYPRANKRVTSSSFLFPTTTTRAFGALTLFGSLPFQHLHQIVYTKPPHLGRAMDNVKIVLATPYGFSHPEDVLALFRSVRVG